MRCPLCGEIFNRLNSKHLRAKHNLTRREYEQLFPNCKTIDTIPMKVKDINHYEQYNKDVEWLTQRYYNKYV